MEIQYNCTMYCIGLYFEIICILIDKELRNLTSSKLLKFIMQDWSKIETCIISLQEATNHWLLLQLNIFKRIQSTQVSLKVTQKTRNTLLRDKYLRIASKCINSFFFFCWHSKYINIYQYYKHTTCVKNKRWLNSITNFENLYKYCVFHYNDTANSENMKNINTAWKANITFHARKSCSQVYDCVNWINNTAIIYNHTNLCQLHR